ncbi:hypothetical protein [Stenotrophomonas riyadhensis]
MIIEDQQDTVVRFKEYSEGTDLTFLSPEDVGLADQVPDPNGGSIEEQLAEFLKAKVNQHEIDLVLLDTDLARQPKLQTHSSYKAALRDLGMPVCRYQKGGRPVRLAMLPQLQRTIRDGASAIWMPRSLVSGEGGRQTLVPRLLAISRAFKAIEQALVARPELLSPKHSPAEVLSIVLGNEDLSFEFLGYAAQNLIYFAKPEESAAGHLISQNKRYATQLGYWLFNYILMFPGPILTSRAAAAFLNVDPDDAANSQAFIKVLEEARYLGPFSDVEPFYWRTKLVDLADAAGGDVTKHASLQSENFRRVDQDSQAVQAFICMISGEAITHDQAAPNPDWVPSGASEAKIKETVLDELGPLAGI